MLRNTGLMHLRRALVCVTALAMLSACGSDDRRSRGGGGETSTQNNPTGGGGGGTQQPGSSSTSSFDVTIEGDGQTSQAKGEQPNTQAGAESWGATIAENRLILTLLSGEGVSISATIETTAALQAPGSFSVSSPPDGTNIVLVDALAGQSFVTQTTGSIRLDSCPNAVGQKAVGSFQNIVLADDFGPGTRTLTGSFDVMVYAKVGELNCVPEPVTPTDPEPNPNPGPVGGSCDGFEPCADDGVCCPYEECVGSCALNCYFQDADCQGGLNPVGCAVCINDCYNTCNVSLACRAAWQDLDDCGERNSCFDAEDDDAEEACMYGNCCSEIKAAY